MSNYTDTDRINFLQSLTNLKAYSGKVVLRDSQNGRGWRLHETSRSLAFSSVRKAIDHVLKYKEGYINGNT